MNLTINPQHAIGRGQLLWLVSGRIPGSDDDTAQLVLAPSDGDARAAFTDWMINSSNMDEETEESLRADHGTVCYIITCEQIGQVEAPDSKDELIRTMLSMLQDLHENIGWEELCSTLEAVEDEVAELGLPNPKED